MDYSPPGSLSMGFSRQEYWSKLLCSPLGDLPEPGIEPVSLMSPANLHWQTGSLPLAPPGKPKSKADRESKEMYTIPCPKQAPVSPRELLYFKG